MTLRNRLRKLQAAAGPPCPACGGPLSKVAPSALDYNRLTLDELRRARDLLRHIKPPPEGDAGERPPYGFTCRRCDRDRRFNFEAISLAELTDLRDLLRKAKGDE